MVFMVLLCALISPTKLHVSADHSFIVPARHPDTTMLPPGKYVNPQIQSL